MSKPLNHEWVKEANRAFINSRRFACQYAPGRWLMT